MDPTVDYMGLEDVRPELSAAGVPCCSLGACPSFDGKRCRKLGFKPDTICEPAVRLLVSRCPGAPYPR